MPFSDGTVRWFSSPRIQFNAFPKPMPTSSLSLFCFFTDSIRFASSACDPTFTNERTPPSVDGYMGSGGGRRTTMMESFGW